MFPRSKPIFVNSHSTSKSPEQTRKVLDSKKQLNTSNRAKEKSPMQNTQKSPSHRKESSSNMDQAVPSTLKNVNLHNFKPRSPERKIINPSIEPTDKHIKPMPILEVLKKTHVERNSIQRSISPAISFNNTTNSFKALAENSDSKGTKEDKNDRKSPIKKSQYLSIR